MLGRSMISQDPAQLTTTLVNKVGYRTVEEVMPRKMIFIMFALLGVVLLIDPHALTAAPTEDQVSSDALNRLRQIMCAQREYEDHNPGQFYPFCAGSICWNYSSIVGSNSEITRFLGVQTAMRYYQPATGDVRFRCRTQGHQTFGTMCVRHGSTQIQTRGKKP